MKYKIRLMQEADLDAVTRLEASCFSMPWKYNDFHDILTNPNRIYLLAELENENATQKNIIGGCVLTDIIGEGEISNVAVSKACRGNHIAQNLLTKLMEIGTEQRNITAFTLEVRSRNTPAINLYKKLGFKSEGIRPNFYDKPKDDAIIMWKRNNNK